MKRIKTILMTVLIAMSVSACTEGPSNKQAEKDSISSAEAGLVDKTFFELKKTTRTNGWKNGELYTVHYDLEFRGTKNYAEMLMATAKILEDELLNAGKMQKSLVLMTIQMTQHEPLKDWVEKNKNTVEYQQTIGKFINEPSKIEHLDRKLLLLGAYGNLTVTNSVPVDFKVGDVYKYWTELSYFKSENGWTLSN